MAERIIDPRLQKLFDDGAHVYSISRLNSLNQCAYAAYMKYVKEPPEIEASNVWACLGGIIHDCLESCIKHEKTEDCLINAIDDELENLEIQEMDFPKGRNGEPTIRNNWISNMTGFANHFKTPQGTFETEQLILYHLRDNIWLQGYIDLIRHNKDGSIWIIDWKTSSMFQGDHLTEAGRQLILYALAKEREGFKVNKISWCMMKYYKASWVDNKGKEKTKVGEWRKLVSDLKRPIENALSQRGFDDVDTEVLLFTALHDNVIPKEVSDLFKVGIYVMDYELTDELKQETLDYINATVDKYEHTPREEKYWEPKDLVTNKGVKENSFWCSSLCGFSKNKKCKYWNSYCASFTKSDEGDDLF